MELGSRFSDRVLVREATRRKLPRWADGFLRRTEDEDRVVLPWCLALRRWKANLLYQIQKESEPPAVSKCGGEVYHSVPTGNDCFS
ncbi:hypothetical protein SLA2020_513300 [Shorea laevis]